MRPPQAWLMPWGTSLARLVPPLAARMTAGGVAAACHLALRRRSLVLHDNVARLCPHLSPVERHRLVRRTWRHLALVWIDVLRLPLFRPGDLEALVEWETRAHLDAALAHGRGVVLVTPHLGGIELAGPYLAALGYRVTGVAEDVDASVFDVLARYRSTTGMRVISRRQAVAAHRVLRRGDVLAIVADRVLAGAPRIDVPWGRGRRSLPTGPAAFALRAGAPLVAACLVRVGSGVPRYRAVTEPLPAAGASVEDLTRLVGAAFERMVRRYPDQWFVFQPGWMDPADAPASRAAIHRGRDEA